MPMNRFHRVRRAGAMRGRALGLALGLLCALPGAARAVVVLGFEGINASYPSTSFASPEPASVDTCPLACRSRIT